MIATSGPSFVGLSPSSILSESLGNRLRKRLASTGSMEYRQTWKRMATRSGRLYWAHTASGHRTSANVSSGWPTPTVKDTGVSETARLGGENLAVTAQLAGWVTPNATDWKDSPGMAETGTNPDGSTRNRLDMLPRQANLCGWVSPTAQDGTRGSLPPRPHDTGIPLSQQVAGIYGWATPRAEDAESCGMRHSRGVADTLSAQAGQDLKSSTAGTEKPAALNPDHSRWLMGYPAAWGSCGATVMQSSRKSPQSSSKPSLK